MLDTGEPVNANSIMLAELEAKKKKIKVPADLISSPGSLPHKRCFLLSSHDRKEGRGLFYKDSNSTPECFAPVTHHLQRSPSNTIFLVVPFQRNSFENTDTEAIVYG